MTAEVIEQTFTVSGPGQLHVSNISGTVIVQPGETGVIRVMAAKHAHAKAKDRTVVEISQAADGSVSARTRFEDENSVLGWLFHSQPCDVDYQIQVPKECSVRVDTVSSSVAISDIEGSCKVHTVSGELALSNIRGSLKLTSVSGEIEGQELQGDLKVENVSGGLRLMNSSIPTAKINTVSGDILLESPLGEGPYKFHSVSGCARLIVPVDTACSVQLQSLSGRFSSELPLSNSDVRPGSSRADVQGGGTTVQMSSVSGCLWLESADNVKDDIEMEVKKKFTPPAQNNSMLDRIENGEISVDEAISELGS